jgi:large subunit ribosomal protein L18
VRSKVKGTAERPRMSVCFTGKNIYVQFVNDDNGQTVAEASTRSKTLEKRDTLRANVTSAQQIGKQAAEAAQAKGIEQVVFDRGSSRYHGKVKALADAAREAGLKF